MTHVPHEPSDVLEEVKRPNAEKAKAGLEFEWYFEIM